MINIILIILELIVSFISLIYLIKKYKIEGIYIFIIIMTIISYIYTKKNISILEINIPLGFISTTSLIICGNILTQLKGKEEIKKYLFIITISTIIGIIIMYLSSTMQNSNYNILSNESFNHIFISDLRTSISLYISLIVTIIISNKIYYNLKKIQNNISVSNIITITIVELLECLIYILISYLYEWSAIEIVLCIVFRYLIKCIIGIIGTLPIYISTKYCE